MSRLGTALALTVAALVVLAAPVRAQDLPAQDSSAPAIDTSSVLMREVFTYPNGDRRDPFEPLSAHSDMGPQFQDLYLAGIIHSPELGSVAVLVDRTTLKRYRLWKDDVIGGAKLIEVRPTEAVFTVMAFGVSRQETLRVKSQEKEQGG